MQLTGGAVASVLARLLVHAAVIGTMAHNDLGNCASRSPRKPFQGGGVSRAISSTDWPAFSPSPAARLDPVEQAAVRGGDHGGVDGMVAVIGAVLGLDRAAVGLSASREFSPSADVASPSADRARPRHGRPR